MKKIILTLLISISFTSLYAEDNQTAQVKNFVKRFYETVLEREAEQAGLDDWTSQLISGNNTASGVAKGFIFSREYENKHTDNTTFLNTLYRAFFDREADSDGFNTWLYKLEEGIDRTEIVHGFLYSQEFTNLSHVYGIRVSENDYISKQIDVEALNAFITRFYQLVINRTPSDNEVSRWVYNLSNGSMGAVSVAKGFIFSREYENKHTDNTTFLNTLYRAFFDREADSDGFNTWLYKLEEGIDRTEIVHGFLYSQEFTNLADDYGIAIEPFNGNSYMLIPPFRQQPNCSNLPNNLLPLCQGNPGEVPAN